MKNTLTLSKVIGESTYKVIANFTNGFAQNVIELEDGTVLFISYDGSEVTMKKTMPITTDEEFMQIINSTEEDC